MRKVVYLIGLSVLLASCFKKQQTNIKTEDKSNPNLILGNESGNLKAISQEYFSKQEDFEKFINTKKWIDLEDEAPCHEYARSITIKDGYFYEYNGIEPSECKIENIKQLNSKTLEVTIEKNCNYGNKFKVEILDYDKRLVRWTIYRGQTFDAKPYVDVCQKTKKKEPYYTKLYNTSSSKLTVNNNWNGAYYFKGGELNLDYILYFSQDDIKLTTQARQYGYTDQLKAVQVGDTLGLFHYKNISGRNYDDTRSYDFLKFYKSSDGKFYFEGKLPYLPDGAIEFEKVK